MADLTESTVEDARSAWLEAIGWRIAHGPDLKADSILANGPMSSNQSGTRETC